MKYDYIYVKSGNNTKPNFFMGSSLRGAFGYLLKEEVCTEPSYHCRSCTNVKNCLYHILYESSVGARPFRFDVKLHADNYDFGLYLFAMETKYIRTMIKTLHRMLHLPILTADKLSFPKHSIVLNGQKIDFNGNGLLLPFEVVPPALMSEKTYHDVAVQLLTPCLIKSADSTFKKEISIEDILLSVYKRKIYFESGENVHTLPYVPQYRLLSSELKDIKTTRRSNRQNKYIVLEGVVGELVLTNLDEKSYLLLKWAEILAAGNKTVFGHGSVKIKS